ncbi:MAG TPA: hypothetical protein VH092_07345 [Urbifossiella sp.]|jgi:hypothetical protein|nr:hypothetical protein [Urbifossiella sp.]
MPAAIEVDPADHTDWAEEVGAGVARYFGFRPRSPEWEDIRGEAVLTMLEKATTFDPRFVPPGGDPGGAFRGWAHPSVRGRCAREAERQRNGGTYHTARATPALAAVPLPDYLADDSDAEPEDPPASPGYDRPAAPAPAAPAGRRLAHALCPGARA